MNKLVHGIGINDLPNTLDENGKQCVIYTKWKDMLRRAYSTQVNDLRKNPTYAGTTVCDEWLLASNFKKWLTSHEDWRNKHVDKDMLVKGNKLYSPETCVMVDKRTNVFLTDIRKNNRKLIGAYPVRNKFRSHVSNPFTGKRECLGYFTLEIDAHKAWQRRKHQIACDLAELQTDNRVAKVLRERYAPDKDWTNL